MVSAGRMYRSTRVESVSWRVWAAIRSRGTPARAALVACPARSEWAVMPSADRPAARARYVQGNLVACPVSADGCT